MTKRGFPDWGDNLASTMIVNHDMNELSARLGGMSRLERSGNVLWYDVGDQGLYPYTIVHAGNGDIYRKPHKGCISGNALHLELPDVENDTTTLTVDIPYSRLAKIGLEFLFDITCETPGAYPWLSVQTIIYNNCYAYEYHFWVDYNGLRCGFDVDNPGGYHTEYIYTYTNPLYPFIYPGRWSHIKLIFDPVNCNFVSSVLNGNYLDLSKWLITPDRINQRNRIEIAFSNWSGVGGYTHKITDIIVTIDEIYRKE